MKTPIVLAVGDIFFVSKIRAVAEHLGVAVRLAKDAASVLELAREAEPPLLIFDLHSTKHNPFAVAAELKNDESLRRIRLIGFYSHVDTALRQQAEASGFDQTLPRSVFTKRLAEILAGHDQRAR
ncbi:MAG: hypothetical protein ABR577_06445 [Pyrinomonadaceae bacterium]